MFSLHILAYFLFSNNVIKSMMDDLDTMKDPAYNTKQFCDKYLAISWRI